MKDFVGATLFVGDTVVYSSFDGSNLNKGKVTKLTPKMVKIEVIGGWRNGREILRDPNYVVKYIGNEVEE